jgi:hypothetical protein
LGDSGNKLTFLQLIASLSRNRLKPSKHEFKETRSDARTSPITAGSGRFSSTAAAEQEDYASWIPGLRLSSSMF